MIKIIIGDINSDIWIKKDSKPEIDFNNFSFNDLKKDSEKNLENDGIIFD